VTNPETPERTRGGVAGRLAGRFKEVAGSMLGHDDLAREGRLQQAQVEAEADAKVAATRADQAEAEAELVAARTENELERERLENELDARERQELIARERRIAERAADAVARREVAEADARGRLQERGADLAERAAEAERLATAHAASELERRAAVAEGTADEIDPEDR
jgi:uncharacterized protein YjbJ (UPF0337 family)